MTHLPPMAEPEPTPQPQPQPPEGVRVRRADGSMTGDLEVEYVGMEGDIHLWQLVGEVKMGPDAEVLIRRLPAKTSLRVEMEE